MAKKGEGEEGKKVKKVDMMRDAFAKLGKSATIADVQKYVLDTYGVELTKAHISQTRSSEKRGKKKRGRKPKSEGTVVVADGSDSLEITDVLALFAEIQRYKGILGAKNVQKVVSKALS